MVEGQEVPPGDVDEAVDEADGKAGEVGAGAEEGEGQDGWRAPLASQSMKGVVSTLPPMSRLRVLGEA